jgi:propionyl-CoA carboxylase beta chain
LRYLIPEDPNVPYEMLSVIKKIVDEGTVFEIMPTYAKNIICGFARMDGRTVGVYRYMHMNIYICIS